MKLRRFILIWIFVLLYSGTSVLYAQHRDTVEVYFPKGSSTLVHCFRSNGERLQALAKTIRQYEEDSLYYIQKIELFSKSSPEGPLAGNETLADKRGKSIMEYLCKSISFVDSIVFVTCLDEDWDYLHRMVQESHDIPNKPEILEIFYNTPPGDTRENRLKQVAGGASWNYMSNNFFPLMRGVELVVTLKGVEPVSLSQLEYLIGEDTGKIEDTLYLKSTPLAAELKPLPQVNSQSWYIKTNIAALGILVANISAEVDLGRKMSVSIPLYYSAWDYFSSNTKFRAIALQPELRYWLSEKHKGFYAAAHATIAWYNIATGGEWRIQDKDGDTPAIGGGISAGYRMPLLKHNSRWMIEFGVGAGAYAVEYDKFHNKRSGTLSCSKKKTYIGPDHLSVNLIYQMSKQRRNSK